MFKLCVNVLPMCNFIWLKGYGFVNKKINIIMKKYVALVIGVCLVLKLVAGRQPRCFDILVLIILNSEVLHWCLCDHEMVNITLV